MRAKATNDTVLSAARKFAANGNDDPSLNDYVAEIGGSKSTIQRLLKENADELAAIKEQVSPVPVAVREASRAFDRQVWFAAIKDADMRFDDQRAQAQKLVSAIAASHDQMANTNLELIKELSIAKDTNVKLQEHIDLLNEERDLYKSKSEELAHRYELAQAANGGATNVIVQLKDAGLLVMPANDRSLNGRKKSLDSSRSVNEEKSTVDVKISPIEDYIDRKGESIP